MRNAVKYALAMTASSSAITLALALAPGVASADTAGGATLFVSAAAPGGDGTSCATANYQTITSAEADATDGDTIIVCPGTYHGTVTVYKSITVQGLPGAVIDASGQPAGVRMAADGAKVEDLTVAVNNS
jgi:nitrous oxidase accessory protein NosD